eukprot:3307299-Prorocentrum_lima.AAC.1
MFIRAEDLGIDVHRSLDPHSKRDCRFREAPNPTREVQHHARVPSRLWGGLCIQSSQAMVLEAQQQVMLRCGVGHFHASVP